MDYVIDDIFLYFATFVTAALTLLSGFGLGTLLTPVLAITYDVKLAISLVAIIHLVNNLFRLALFRNHVDYSIVRRFGLISIIGALIGASLQLTVVSNLVLIILALFLILFGLNELLVQSRRFRLPRKHDLIGGFFSGLLGGFMGNQGAIRSAYLLNYDITRQSFIATATVIALLIDVTRIPIYLIAQHEALFEQWPVIFMFVLFAIAGTVGGKKLLERITERQFRSVVATAITGLGFMHLYSVFFHGS